MCQAYALCDWCTCHNYLDEKTVVNDAVGFVEFARFVLNTIGDTCRFYSEALSTLASPSVG